jgi:hypothetical protein
MAAMGSKRRRSLVAALVTFVSSNLAVVDLYEVPVRPVDMTFAAGCR